MGANNYYYVILYNQMCCKYNKPTKCVASTTSQPNVLQTQQANQMCCKHNKPTKCVANTTSQPNVSQVQQANQMCCKHNKPLSVFTNMRKNMPTKCTRQQKKCIFYSLSFTSLKVMIFYFLLKTYVDCCKKKKKKKKKAKILLIVSRTQFSMRLCCT